MNNPFIDSSFSTFNQYWITILLVFLGVNAIIAQDYVRQYKFEQLHVGNGLSHNYTMDIVQDEQGFIWIGTLHGLQRYDGQHFTTYLNEPANSNSIAGNSIDYLALDTAGQLLIGFIDKKGLDRFDFKTETFIHEEASDHLGTLIGQLWSNTSAIVDSIGSLNSRNRQLQFIPHPSSIELDKVTIHDFIENTNGSKWLATSVGLYQIYKNEKRGQWWLTCDTTESKTKPFSVNQLLEDGEGNLWLATDKGLYIKYQNSTCLTPFYFPNNDYIPFENKKISSISFDYSGQLWVSSSVQDIHILDLKNFELENIYSSSNQVDSKIKNIQKIFFDRSGNGWFLTGLDGVHILHSETHQFQWFIDKKKNNKIAAPLWTVFEDSKNKLWHLGDEVTTTNNSISPKLLDQLGSCYDMEQSSANSYWFCTAGSGVKRLDTDKGVIEHFSKAPATINSGSITAKYLAKDGNLWVGSWGGAAALIKTDDLSNPTIYPCTKNEAVTPIGCYIQCILESRAGLIYFGSAESGFSILDPKDNSWKSFHPTDNKQHSIKHKYVRCVVEDHDAMIWLGTYGGGLYRYNPQTEEFKHFGRSSGLPDEVIEELIVDNKGFIWIVTTKRLTKFNPKTEIFQTFDDEDGMPNVQFHRMSYANRTSGKMHLSTDQGYVSFHPDSIRTDTLAPNTAIVNMIRYRNGDNGVEAIKVNGINQLSSLDLSYLDYIIRFEFSAIKFHKGSKATIEYKLAGFQKDWISLGNSRQVSFTSLPAGRYTLMVRSTNANGVRDASPASLILNISPPWWKTWWSYLLYILLGAGVLMFFWKREARRLKLKNQLEKEQLKANQLHELDKTKTRFFSNISHEFRTPLTVILGMAEEIKEPTEVKSLIQKSSQNLLRLINQMLDISKMDAGKLKLQLKTGDLLQYLKYIKESFEPLAAQKNIALSLQANQDSLKMKFDDEKIQHIIFNLLSNAIKYTPNKGQIKIVVNQSATNPSLPISIAITDSGIGIPIEDQPFVFDRYFQAKNSKIKSELGTGIGLSFTKELVELMSGEIEMKSELGAGSIFTIRLPYVAPDLQNDIVVAPSEPLQYPKEVIPTIQKSIAPNNPDQASKPSLLLIEDNPQVVSYISLILEKEYEIATAENGERGIEMAIEGIPDIIISDVMMPIKDGYEVTDFLKNDERTSHIPIILLTAKASDASRLEGIDRGADAYLTKPFLKKELLLRLSRMIELRKKLQSRYQSFHPVPATQQKDAQIEDVFLSKIRNLIEANLSKSEFGVNELCQAAGLSQSQLFRKLKALTDKSTSAYLRGFRLHKAKALLEQGAMNVSEVAYAVGFNDPLYFSRVFSKAYGIPPKDIN